MKVAQLSPLIDDAELERQIDRAREELIAAKPEDRRAKWEVMRDLIHSRSPAQIRRMEARLGLLR